ncbi:hypothetical protein P3X46_034431, partial [Hevea brasiliensis]
NGSDNPQKAEAIYLLDIMNRFEFVFVLHLMKKILGITHELSQVLQRRNQDIINAMNLVKVSKFVLDMEDVYVTRGRSRCRSEEITNLHHYHVMLFLNTNFLLCMVFLNPKDSFSAFNTSKLIQLAKFCPCEFSPVALIELECQLENFVFDMHMDKKFSEVSGIGGLAEKMVATKKTYYFSFGIFVNQIIINLASCYSHSGKSFFCNEYL